ncbi:dihydroorotase [Neisseria gonorrhoeae]|uniref:Dihydroorotase n=1 Tax=Neisseria gonorrhoeae TaxID=485 RepID=A0A378W1Q9_NEIGO|nr:dihydroorotase [Neisseria gonorrhoeae]
MVAAVTGEKAHKFFLGTDSAPHAKSAKENACGCAGMFSAMTAVELYAEVFEKAGALDKLEAFASKTAQGSTAFRKTPTRLPLSNKAKPFPQASLTATANLSRCARAAKSAGRCSID